MTQVADYSMDVSCVAEKEERVDYSYDQFLGSLGLPAKSRKRRDENHTSSVVIKHPYTQVHQLHQQRSRRSLKSGRPVALHINFPANTQESLLKYVILFFVTMLTLSFQ